MLQLFYDTLRMMIIMKDIRLRNNVKVTRISSNLYSQQELAKVIGISRQSMNLIEAEKYNPSLKICFLICKALDENLDSLFWYEDM